MSRFNALQDRVRTFRDDRDWERFHTPKNLSMALTVEAAELMELFQWHDNIETDRVREDEEFMERIREELADVLLNLIQMADCLDVDLIQAAQEKMEKNEEKYPADDIETLNAELDRWRHEWDRGS